MAEDVDVAVAEEVPVAVAKGLAAHPEPPADHVNVDPPAVGGGAAPGLVRVLPSHAR